MYEKEIAFLERLLQEDIRNNSAWNQRFYVVTSFPTEDEVFTNGGFMEEQGDSVPALLSGKVLDREVAFTLKAIKKVTRNESAWNYLRG